jgi:hypothetical protein
MLLDLPSETLRHICIAVAVGERELVTSGLPNAAVAPLCTVSRRLRSLATPLLYAAVVVRDPRFLARLVAHFDRHPHLPRNVRSLRLARPGHLPTDAVVRLLDVCCVHLNTLDIEPGTLTFELEAALNDFLLPTRFSHLTTCSLSLDNPALARACHEHPDSSIECGRPSGSVAVSRALDLPNLDTLVLWSFTALPLARTESRLSGPRSSLRVLRLCQLMCAPDQLARLLMACAQTVEDLAIDRPVQPDKLGLVATLASVSLPRLSSFTISIDRSPFGGVADESGGECGDLAHDILNLACFKTLRSLSLRGPVANSSTPALFPRTLLRLSLARCPELTPQSLEGYVCASVTGGAVSRGGCLRKLVVNEGMEWPRDAALDLFSACVDRDVRALGDAFEGPGRLLRWGTGYHESFAEKDDLDFDPWDDEEISEEREASMREASVFSDAEAALFADRLERSLSASRTAVASG